MDDLDAEDEALRVYRLMRVSSNDQVEGAGLAAQDRIIKDTLEDLDVDTDIVDKEAEEGVSGTKFPRPSLMQIFAYARRGEIDAIVVKEVSRIGRVAGPVFGFIWTLKTRFDVDVITENGIFNIRQKPDLIQMFFESLTAEVKNRFRTNSVMDAQMESFRCGNIHVTGRKAGFGYRKVLDEEYEPPSGEEKKSADAVDQNEYLKEYEKLELAPSEAEVVESIFDIAAEIGPTRNLFQRIKEHLRDEFSEERLPEENSEYKKILRDPTYIGEPTWEINLSNGEVKRETQDREELAIVDPDLFEEVSDIMDIRRAKYYDNNSTDVESSESRVPLQQMASMMGLSRLVAFDDVVRIHCPDCGAEMQDNGKWRATTSIRPSNMTDLPEEPILKRYKCPNDDCERSEKRFPNEFEGYMLFNADIPLDTLVTQV